MIRRCVRHAGPAIDGHRRSLRSVPWHLQQKDSVRTNPAHPKRTYDIVGNRSTDVGTGASIAACNATSRGITSTETPHLPTASRMAIARLRGICLALDTSSQ
jgi:hypothetical protein